LDILRRTRPSRPRTHRLATAQRHAGQQLAGQAADLREDGAMDTALLVKAFAGLFAIMNPFVALPMFLSLTNDYSLQRQRRTVVRVTIGCIAMCGVLIASGAAVLDFFGVSVNDFRVAGGIVLLIIALGMLNGGSAVHSGTADEQAQQSDQAAQGDVAFYPLTFPILVGPGTITTIIVFTGHAHNASGYVTVSIAALLVIALLFIVLWFAPSIGHHMGKTLRTIMTRLMGMILAGIAVGMIMEGVSALLPGLAK